jgi:hypothetical protein
VLVPGTETCQSVRDRRPNLALWMRDFHKVHRARFHHLDRQANVGRRGAERL